MCPFITALRFRSAPAFRGGHKLTARRTLPFQLVGESPMGYARSRSFVGEYLHVFLFHWGGESKEKGTPILYVYYVR